MQPKLTFLRNEHIDLINKLIYLKSRKKEQIMIINDKTRLKKLQK